MTTGEFSGQLSFCKKNPWVLGKMPEFFEESFSFGQKFHVLGWKLLENLLSIPCRRKLWVQCQLCNYQKIWFFDELNLIAESFPRLWGPLRDHSARMEGEWGWWWVQQHPVSLLNQRLLWEQLRRPKVLHFRRRRFRCQEGIRHRRRRRCSRHPVRVEPMWSHQHRRADGSPFNRQGRGHDKLRLRRQD